MNDKAITYKSLWVFALILSLGLIVAAAVLGYGFKYFNSSTNSITVKGLAEKPIKADSARWEIDLITSSNKETVSAAYQLLDQEMKTLVDFFVAHGFKVEELRQGNKSSDQYYEDVSDAEGKYRREFKGYTARQSVVIHSQDIDKIAQAANDIYKLDEIGISIKQKPEYLVSNLEEIKMSLIANATQNAHSRANEFAKVGQVQVGAMRTASQGSFYILPENGSDEDSDYGGSYDKDTINKIARVVVTINYAIN